MGSPYSATARNGRRNEKFSEEVLHDTQVFRNGIKIGAAKMCIGAEAGGLSSKEQSDRVGEPAGPKGSLGTEASPQRADGQWGDQAAGLLREEGLFHLCDGEAEQCPRHV